jgi:hypothetical protein
MHEWKMNRKTAAFLDENLFQFGKQLLGLHAFWDLFERFGSSAFSFKAQ